MKNSILVGILLFWTISVSGQNAPIGSMALSNILVADPIIPNKLIKTRVIELALSGLDSVATVSVGLGTTSNSADLANATYQVVKRDTSYYLSSKDFIFKVVGNKVKIFFKMDDSLSSAPFVLAYSTSKKKYCIGYYL